ncbi:MAG: alpha/beta fold hydrolase [Jatrophihabitantaceae bacterium]
MSDPCAVLVHGLWHGAWSWDPVRALLAERGIASVAVELAMITLEDDVASVRSVLDTMPGPVALVGHSYGGAVITAAGVHPAVRQLIYIAAFQLDEGESISRVRPDLGIAATGLGAALRFSADGSQVSLDPRSTRELLYQQADVTAARAAIERLRPVGRALFSARPSAIAWHDVASSYAICTADRCVAPQLQQAMAARATRSVHWPSDHTPLLSQPHSVAELIATDAQSGALSA